MLVGYRYPMEVRVSSNKDYIFLEEVRESGYELYITLPREKCPEEVDYGRCSEHFFKILKSRECQVRVDSKYKMSDPVIAQNMSERIGNKEVQLRIDYIAVDDSVKKIPLSGLESCPEAENVKFFIRLHLLNNSMKYIHPFLMVQVLAYGLMRYWYWVVAYLVFCIILFLKNRKGNI